MSPTNDLRVPAPPPVEYATKADVDALRQELKSDIRELRLELKADLANLKAELRKDINDLQKTIITSQIAVVAIFGTLVTVLKLFA